MIVQSIKKSYHEKRAKTIIKPAYLERYGLLLTPEPPHLVGTQVGYLCPPSLPPFWFPRSF